MRISTEVVRKLAKLDPALREVFYSFLDDIERGDETDLLKEKMEEMIKELNSFREEMLRDMASFQEGFISELKLLHSRVEMLGDKVEEVSEKQGDISGKVEILSEASRENKGGDDIKSQVEKAVSQFKETMEEKFEGFKREIEKLKERIGTKERLGIFKNLPKVLKKRLSLNLKDHIRSKIFKGKDKEISFDIFASGTKNKKKCALVGKILHRPDKKDIESLGRDVDILVEEKVLPQNVVKLVVVEEIEEDVEKFASKKGVFILWNQDL